MTASTQLSPETAADTSVWRKLVALAPIAAVLTYPFLLKGFHLGVAQPSGPLSAAGLSLAAFCLLGAMATPIFGLVWARQPSRRDLSSAFDRRARRLAYLAITAPPLFVFTGVARGLLGVPLRDETIWICFWLIVAAAAFAGVKARLEPKPGRLPIWRVAHGVSAAFIACFVLFHLINHALGWLGPEAHTTIMHLGRRVYRSPFVEPVLIGLLLFQVVSGVRLAWRWSAEQPADWHRVLQIGSGAYLAAFVITHLNSALVSARLARGADTDWAWASGAPDGLIYDSWNIRLLPHYAFGVFFVLSHLASGLRQVLIAHGVNTAAANRIWVAGLIVSAAGSATIIAALIGARI